MYEVYLHLMTFPMCGELSAHSPWNKTASTCEETDGWTAARATGSYEEEGRGGGIWTSAVMENPGSGTIMGCMIFPARYLYLLR